MARLHGLSSVCRTCRAKLYSLKWRAMLSNPAVQNLEVLCVKRGWNDKITPGELKSLGIASNHECHSSLRPTGYVNEIAVFRAADPQASWKTLYRPEDKGWVGDLDLHWNADRILFSKADKTQWSLWEMNLDGSGMRRITQTPPDVDCFDPCYLPDGRILCASNATSQCVPCWHGTARKDVANLFVMNADGSDMRRVTFDQDHNMHPAVLDNGRVIYNRWDYTGINRVFARPLMVMNPDGTDQRAFYGSNSWFPNGLYSPRSLPGKSGQLLSILSGYHGPGRTGHLVVVDVNQGTQEAEGIVKRISGRGLPLGGEVHGPPDRRGLAQVSFVLSDHRQALPGHRVDVARIRGAWASIWPTLSTTWFFCTRSRTRRCWTRSPSSAGPSRPSFQARSNLDDQMPPSISRTSTSVPGCKAFHGARSRNSA